MQLKHDSKLEMGCTTPEKKIMQQRWPGAVAFFHVLLSHILKTLASNIKPLSDKALRLFEPSEKKRCW